MDDFKLSRRSLVKAAALAGVAQVASPFVITARAADAVKIGLDNPLTGTYAALGKNELIGCQLARRADQRQGRHPRPPGRAAGRGLDQRRRRHRGAEGAQADRPRQGQLPARQRELGAGAGDGAGRATRRASCTSCPGGHTDAVTGTNCHWNVFRVCNTTQMEANAVAGALIKKYGKKWYYITPDYAFGHTLQRASRRPRRKLGGTEGRRRPDAARHHRLLLLPDQGAGGEPRRHHLPACRATT